MTFGRKVNVTIRIVVAQGQGVHLVKIEIGNDIHGAKAGAKMPRASTFDGGQSIGTTHVGKYCQTSMGIDIGCQDTCKFRAGD